MAASSGRGVKPVALDDERHAGRLGGLGPGGKYLRQEPVRWIVANIAVAGNVGPVLSCGDPSLSGCVEHGQALGPRCHPSAPLDTFVRPFLTYHHHTCRRSHRLKECLPSRREHSTQSKAPHEAPQAYLHVGRHRLPATSAVSCRALVQRHALQAELPQPLQRHCAVGSRCRPASTAAAPDGAAVEGVQLKGEAAGLPARRHQQRLYAVPKG